MSEPLSVQRIEDHPIWGDCVFLTAQTDDPEEVRTAYTEWAAAAGRPSLHFAISGPTEAELDPWYRLGFAQMHAYGVRASGAEPFAVDGVTLRRGRVGDLETALRLDRLVYDAQAASPSFSSYTFDDEDHRRTWLEALEADDVTYMVAERNGRSVGHVTLYPDPEDDGALHLASTAVLPEARGGGVGRLLTSFALAHAAERGYPRLRTNWRVTNLVASRYWPARGFAIARLRLFRRLPDL